MKWNTDHIPYEKFDARAINHGFTYAIKNDDSWCDWIWIFVKWSNRIQSDSR